MNLFNSMDIKKTGTILLTLVPFPKLQIIGIDACTYIRMLKLRLRTLYLIYQCWGARHVVREPFVFYFEANEQLCHDSTFA